MSSLNESMERNSRRSFALVAERNFETRVFRFGLHLGGCRSCRSFGCDMKLHSVLLGGAILTKPLRVSAGTPRKHASGGLSRSRGYCQGCEAFPEM